MSSRVLSYVASNIAIDCCKFNFTRETKIGKGGPVLAAKIGSAGLILAAKVVQGDQFWQNFLPKLVQPDRL